MSDLGALSVTCEPTSLTGCNPKESLLCHRFASCLVCCAAGVIAGAKPSALFSFDPGAVLGDGGAAVGRVVDTYARLLPGFGVSLACVGRSGRRLNLLVWRRDLVTSVLGDADKRELLRAAGHDVRDADRLMGSFSRDLRAFFGCHDHMRRGGHRGRLAFPHEIGLVLGYPLADVIGFMCGGRETCRGPWKAYGDVEEARREFGRLRMQEERCRERFAYGVTLASLLRGRGGAAA